MKPPTGGPSTGATRPGQVMKDIARTRSFFSVVRNTAKRPTGTIIAPLIPCSTRAATKVSKLSLNPHINEDRLNSTIAELKTRREPKRSANQPLMGMNTATASM
ncbi:hypothetical protein D3C71_1659750 [compost metagenome]